MEIFDYHRQNCQPEPVTLTDRPILNIHRGEVLQDEFLRPMSLSQNRLAREIGVPPRRINRIVKGQRAITADIALRPGRRFGKNSRFRPGLRMDCGLEEAAHQLDVA